MTTEIVLLFVIIALVGLIIHEKRESRILWDKYMKNLKAVDAKELRDLELTEKVKIETTPAGQSAEMIAESDMSDEDFLKMVRGDNGKR